MDAPFLIDLEPVAMHDVEADVEFEENLYEKQLFFENHHRLPGGGGFIMPAVGRSGKLFPNPGANIPSMAARWRGLRDFSARVFLRRRPQWHYSSARPAEGFGRHDPLDNADSPHRRKTSQGRIWQPLCHQGLLRGGSKLWHCERLQ